MWSVIVSLHLYNMLCIPFICHQFETSFTVWWGKCFTTLLFYATGMPNISRKACATTSRHPHSTHPHTLTNARELAKSMNYDNIVRMWTTIAERQRLPYGQHVCVCQKEEIVCFNHFGSPGRTYDHTHSKFTYIRVHMTIVALKLLR